jgi:radical SAM protein (TIGR01212 family)
MINPVRKPPYLGFNEVLRQHFGSKVYRVTLNAGLSCPNVDGTRAKGGCTFCNDDYLLAKSWHKQLAIPEQLAFGINYVRERHPNTDKFLAYFQNGTNTHAPVSFLRTMFEEALKNPEIVGLILSTRPDCLGPEVLDLLSELNERTYLWVELGLQSAQDRILESVNRAHTVAEFATAVHHLYERGIRNCAHMILGLPGETREEMLAGADFLNDLPVTGVKIHNLFVTKHTVLEKDYKEGRYQPLELSEYADLCVSYLEKLRPDIVIHRLNAHGPARLTVAPEWSINKLATMNAVHAEIERRGTWQGKLYVSNQKESA